MSLKPGRADEALRSLTDHIVPMSKQRPGFVKGTWYGDGESQGFALLTYSSRELAEQAAADISSTGPGADDPIALESVDVYAVQAEA
ncbi:hypothetical protein [Actinomycetospora succinea]|uniref:hypothetical protein n=1 Tax=Actinomycetospora succinea TaxID=663603 RepID=UPI001060BB1A|nr:hypothetical protein [Actinomycetospora succinea]